eukprot:jgi/Tetstr1/457136/TSEL_043786.t1
MRPTRSKTRETLSRPVRTGEGGEGEETGARRESPRLASPKPPPLPRGGQQRVRSDQHRSDPDRRYNAAWLLAPTTRRAWTLRKAWYQPLTEMAAEELAVEPRRG